MEEEFKIILNMQDEMFNIFKKSQPKEGYEIIAKERNVLFIKKSDINLSKDQIARILSIAKLQRADGILFVDITSAVKYLITVPEEKIKNDVKFRWMIRQAFTKAILDKPKNGGLKCGD